jgi:adenosylcobinamide-GDP ribazoletransferase
VRALLAAVKFLTSAPVPWTWTGGEGPLGRSLPWFPVVGLLTGGVLGGVCYGLQPVLPALPLAALLVALMAGVSGGLHLDGLSDSADGLLSSRPRERALEIMKDSHVGAMGVIAIVLVLLAKFSLLVPLAPDMRWRAVILAVAAGRCTFPVTMGLLPYARREGGLATVFSASLTPPWRRRATLVWALLVPPAAGWLLAGWWGLAAGATGAAAGLLWTGYSRYRLGGYTGDTLGAGCELAELAPLLVAVLWG